MFGYKGDFQREVMLEIAYARELHGEGAIDFIRARAARPLLRGWRRKILLAAVRHMERERQPPRGLFGLLKT